MELTEDDDVVVVVTLDKVLDDVAVLVVDVVDEPWSKDEEAGGPYICSFCRKPPQYS